MRVALTRKVSASIARCELTHLERVPIDLARARAQHRAYEDALAALGCELRRLPEAPDLPDAVFVEDTAVVLDDVAVIARPGAASRRAEVASVARALEPYRPLIRIEAPATLDGGDVLVLGRRVWVGASSRTGAAGIDALRRALEPRGYRVVPVEVRGCLHLKSAVTAIAPGAVLLNPARIDPGAFAGLEPVEVDPGEPAAANALAIAGTVLLPASYPRTRERLERAGFRTRTVEADELAKAEGALTCCSLVFAA